MRSNNRHVFGYPKMPKEFAVFLLIAIILCNIFEDLWFYLALPIVVAIIKIWLDKKSNDPFSDFEK